MIFLGKTEIASNTDVKTHVPKIACTLKILTSENFLLIPGFLKCLLMKNPKNRCWNLSDIYIDKLWDTDIRIATYILQYVKIFSFKVFWQHYILLVRPLLTGRKPPESLRLLTWCLELINYLIN